MKLLCFDEIYIFKKKEKKKSTNSRHFKLKASLGWETNHLQHQNKSLVAL